MWPWKKSNIEWKPKARARLGKRESALKLASIQVDDVLEIVHKDMGCQGDNSSCSLKKVVVILRKANMKIEWYHTKRHVAVFRRTE